MRGLTLLLALLVTFFSHTGTSSAQSGGGEAVVIPVKGEISKATFIFVRRALKEAEERNAAAIILDMDTYGGEIEAAIKIVDALGQLRPTTQTITFINPNAASAGAMIAIATKKIYMAPLGAIGAAAPILSTGEDLPKTALDKEMSYRLAQLRGVAERNGHNADLIEAFMSKEKEVKIGERIIHPKGTLLTLNTQQATEVIDGKPVLAVGEATSLAEVARKAGVRGGLIVIEPTGFESTAFWITTLAPMLLLAGMLLVWLEFKTAGLGAAGALALACFALFFFGHLLAGLAGWEAPVIFTIGLALLLVEFLLLPGLILPGVLGVLLMFGGLVWAMVDYYPAQGTFPTMAALEGPLVKFALALSATCAIAAILVRYLPQSRLFRLLILETEGAPGPSFSPTASEFSGLTVGDEGVSSTILRPSGKAVIGGSTRDVITQGEFVEAGVPVRIIALEGVRIVVASIQPV